MGLFLPPWMRALLAVALPYLLLSQVAILQVRVVEGEGTVYPPGSRGARGLVVQVSDETGRPVAGAAVSFRLPDEGPSGLFANGLRSELAISDAQGRASVRGLQVNRVAGPFEIRITVAKDQIRAGTISRQYIADSRAATASTASSQQPVSTPPVVAPSKSRGKWIALTLILVGAAGGGVAYALSQNKSQASAPVQPALSIGAPVITIGKP